ncbi:MAG: glycosyltransferase [Candidatus Pacebacteria bacterium]|nr:glycosyltransferase [Candidatus Paceibacterota bacterium]
MENLSQPKMWVVCLGTYPPRECGIATFTADFVEYFDELFVPHEETKVVAMNTEDSESLTYPDKVIFQISENKPEEYVAVAKQLNEMPHVKLISVQHEFGIFGANDGENLLFFLREIQKPVTVTFHTVLPNPSEHLKKVACEIIERANKLIVMTELSKALLEDKYMAQAEKIAVIPHGLHPRPYTDGKLAKSSLGLEGKKVLSTFGLLNKGKGIEFAIAALPEIIREYPDTVYAVIGATHPVVLRREGRVYIESLKEQVRRLGLEKNVIFYERYMKTNELLRFLEATDVYLSLSQNPDQAVSGTLTYALGMGRPVVSTHFAQAREVITPELGMLVDFNNVESISRSVVSIFGDCGKLLSMSKTAYFRTRNMTWPNVALSYMREFKKLSPELATKGKSLPPIKLDHLKRMTDDFGIFQFANLTDPDPSFGYTIDDNSRALVVACWYAKLIAEEEKTGLFKLAEIYLSFLERAAKEDGGFRNYYDQEHRPDEERNKSENLEDADARAARALAVLCTSQAPEFLRERAKAVFKKQYSFSKEIHSPRAVAFHIKALALWLKVDPEAEEIKNRLVSFADFLVDGFHKNSTPDWRWFERGLTYSNAVIPEALLFAYRVTKNEEYLKIAKVSLNFLVDNSFSDEICVPVGQAGWFKQGGIKPLYDQQPEEVSALVLALQTMFEITQDPFYLEKKEQAFDWFTGSNVLGQIVYSPTSGGSYDGLGENQVNLNQGAESTLSYLLARAAMVEPPHSI